MDNTILEIHYLQSFKKATSGHFRESDEVSIKINFAALASGWLAQFTGYHGNDLAILLAIAMHARPLKDPDLSLLIGLGIAAIEDEGRLYARVTDEGLATELSIHRSTVDASTARLAEQEFISIHRVEQGFRDSKGQFAGSKVFLISGSLSGAFVKDFSDLEGHRAERLSTVTDHVERLSTVKPTAVLNLSTYRAKPLDTNTDDDLKDDEGEEDRLTPIVPNTEDFPEAIRSLFADITGKAEYELTPGDLKAITRLSKCGATLDEVGQGIRDVLASGKKPKTFAYCAPQVEKICQNRSTQPRQPNAKPTMPQPISDGQTATVTDTRQPHTIQPTPHIPTEPIPEEIKSSADIFRQLTGATPTPEQIALMLTLSSLADEAAHKTDETGAQWLYAALKECSFREGIRYPLRYAATTIRNRVSAPAPKKNGNGNGEQITSSVNTDAPEVALYRSVTGFAPRPDQVDALVEKLSGKSWTPKYLLTFWREWCARDHKRHNLGWLDWAQDGRIPKPTMRTERKKTVNLS